MQVAIYIGLVSTVSFVVIHHIQRCHFHGHESTGWIGAVVVAGARLYAIEEVVKKPCHPRNSWLSPLHRDGL